MSKSDNPWTTANVLQVQSSEKLNYKHDSAIINLDADNSSSALPPPPYIKPSENPPPLPPMFPETAQFLKDEEMMRTHRKKRCCGSVQLSPRDRRKRRICCGIFLVIGIFVAIVGMIFGINRARCHGLNPTSQPLQTYTFDGSKYTNAELDFEMHGGYHVRSDLRFVSSSDSNGKIAIRVASFQSVPAPLEQTTSDSYTFRIDPRPGPFPFFGWFSQPPACIAVSGEISVPTGNHESLTVAASDGSLTFTEIANATYNRLTAKSHNGEIHITGAVPAKSLVADAHNGEVEIQRVNNPSLSVTVTAFNGEIDIKDVTASSVRAEAHNGKIKLARASIGTVNLVSHNGEVDVEQWGGSNLTAHSNNGKVVGKVVEIKDGITVQMSSNNGEIDLEMSSSYKGAFEVKTNNGESRVTGSGLSFSKTSNNNKAGYKDSLNPGSSITLSSNNGRASLKFV